MTKYLVDVYGHDENDELTIMTVAVEASTWRDAQAQGVAIGESAGLVDCETLFNDLIEE